MSVQFYKISIGPQDDASENEIDYTPSAKYKVKSLQTIMRLLQHTHIDILRISTAIQDNHRRAYDFLAYV